MSIDFVKKYEQNTLNFIDVVFTGLKEGGEVLVALFWRRIIAQEAGTIVFKYIE